jgi:hypothetical protein
MVESPLLRICDALRHVLMRLPAFEPARTVLLLLLALARAPSTARPVLTSLPGFARCTAGHDAKTQIRSRRHRSTGQSERESPSCKTPPVKRRI